ncbi:MAG: glutathione S-transferase family protein [Thiotrichales bacterium]|nr:glutathione S-transferase family protein [Thiotrichales bacterium]
MIKLYGLEISFPVNRVRLCLNAMDLAYEFIQASPLSGDTQTEEYLKMSPAGKIPAIDVEGVTLFESNAIMKYLCRKYDSGFYPADIEAQARVDAWCDFTAIHVANGVGKVLFNKCLAPMLEMDVDEQSLQDGYAFIDRFFGVADQQLGNSTCLAGDQLTIADFGLLATVDPAEVLEVDMSKYPKLAAWQTRLMKEKYYQDMHQSYAATLDAMMAAMSE